MVEVVEDEILEESNEVEFNESHLENRIFCANCIHCKLVRRPVENGSKYYLRVKCEAGKWRKKLGEEKLYKYFTVARRSIEECEMYEAMGDIKEYMKDLKKSLPIRDEIYNS